MAYYRECPYCGVNLDPGERCDCREREAAEAVRLFSRQMESRERFRYITPEMLMHRHASRA